jgi:hypothetical protein
MTLEKCDHTIKFEVKLKTKIEKSKYSVLVACRVPNAVNKASYLQIFCCNALSTCTKVADLSILNDMVKKMSKIYSKLAELRYIFRSPLNFGIAAGNIYGSQQI